MLSLVLVLPHIVNVWLVNYLVPSLVAVCHICVDSSLLYTTMLQCMQGATVVTDPACA